MYGDWASPITPRMMASGGRFDDVQWDADGDTLVWLEKRGAGGVIVAQTGTDAPRDLTSEADKVRGGVGYGGGEFCVHQGVVTFAGQGGRLYNVPLSGGIPKPITPGFGAAASPTVSPDGRWIVYVHSYEEVDGLALVDVDGDHFPRKLAYGSDFVMQPAWHPRGGQLAYITWDHPNMPWDSTTLWLAEVRRDADGVPALASRTALVSGMSLMQPGFSPDGRYLAYIGESKGWWQVFVYDTLSASHKPITTATAEHGVPAWVQGVRSFGWSPDSSAIYVLRNTMGFFSLWRCDLRGGREQQLTEIESYASLRQIAVTTGRIALIASSPTTPDRVISVESETPALTQEQGGVVIRSRAVRVHRRSAAENLPASSLSLPQAISWVSEDGETVYGLYYPPAYPQVPEGDTPPESLPPLLVLVHGGPTSQTSAGYSAQVQFFAARGYSVLVVNHRGSTGYGRAYRDRLRALWGVLDVQDCASGAAYLAQSGLIDPAKVAIMGGSAGGYTVLNSLASRPGVYKAGVCLYGISDLFALALDTHKFESRYNDSLFGALPDAAAVWRERSPILHADRMRDPIIIFQGADDKVVPPSQSEMIVHMLRRKNIPHEYHVFEGEGHGFRKPENIETMYTAAAAFLRKHVVYS
jgi:dipeptidyl aminopeptidase/acylaminoacyl peptidase